MCCKFFFHYMHFPSFVKSLNSNVTLQGTICGFDGLWNSALREKTRISMSSVPNLAHFPMKQSSQVQIFPATIKKNVFQKAEISKSAGGISFHCIAAGASNDQVKSENIHVFISFRGETRAGFTSHLHKRLKQAGYRTFMDKSMRRGVDIEKELIKAIRNSQVSIVVISPGYASSHSCLDELVEILRCRKRFGHKVLPVFYYVDPDEVYYQNNNFGAAFDGLVKHLGDSTDKRVGHWKEALKEVAGISGLVLRQYEYETDFIDQIVAEVKELLSPTPHYVPAFLVLASILICIQLIHGFKLHQILNHISSLG